MIPLKTIEDLIGKHTSLEKDLSSGSIDKKNFAEKSKEYSDLNEIIDNAKRYISFKSEKSDLQKILDDRSSDEELKKMAEKELNDLVLENEINEKKLKLFLLPNKLTKMQLLKLEQEQVLEASLFAADLFDV